MTKEEAWKVWVEKHRPQNEEAFWICFTDAWRVCEDEHNQPLSCLRQRLTGRLVGTYERTLMERQVGNWLLGFTIGILTTLASQKLLSEPQIANDSEMARAEELISIYKRGVKDALRTTPVSFELEQTCLEVWANKQPVENK
jgi:hypothetical protein